MIPALTDHFLFAPLKDRPQLLDGIWLDRHWHVEPAPAWSRGRVASLAVSAEHFPVPTPLLMRLSVFGASPKTPRTLTVTSAGHPPFSRRVCTSAPILIMTSTPHHAKGATHSAMQFGVDTLSSPAKTRLSDDERLLGVRILSLKTDVSRLSWPLQFTRSGPVHRFLDDGWAPLEPDTGRWSIGEKAGLVLPGHLRTDGITGIVLDISVLPRPEGCEALEVDIATMGTRAETWQTLDPSTRRLWCPTPEWHANSDYSISLHFRNFLSPYQLGINHDIRPLGILLRRIDPMQGFGSAQ